MLALGIESESEEIRKDMVKRLERQKIQTAFANMREAGHQVVRVLHLRLSGRDARRRWTRRSSTRSSWIPTSRTSIRPCPIPGTALYEKCVRDGLLRPEEGLVEDGVLVLPAATATAWTSAS